MVGRRPVENGMVGLEKEPMRESGFAGSFPMGVAGPLTIKQMHTRTYRHQREQRDKPLFDSQVYKVLPSMG